VGGGDRGSFRSPRRFPGGSAKVWQSQVSLFKGWGELHIHHRDSLIHGLQSLGGHLSKGGWSGQGGVSRIAVAYPVPYVAKDARGDFRSIPLA
jgi:hypothetical protein